MLRLRFFRVSAAVSFLSSSFWPSSFSGGGAVLSASASPRASDNCSAMMTALFSDRAPKMIVLSFAIVASNASILPSQASTISIS